MIDAAWHALPRWLHLVLLSKALHDSLPRHLTQWVFYAVYHTVPLHHPSIAPARPLAVLPPYCSTVYDAPSPKHRVVLLHGWAMSSKDWTQNAKMLRKRYGHAVLTIDFYGHGASPYLPKIDHHDPNVLVHQVRDAVRRAGWSHEQITIAGISMGSAIALRYAQWFPEHVERLILMCGAGMSVQRWYGWAKPLGYYSNRLLLKFHQLNRNPFWHAVFHQIPWLKALLSQCYLTRLTPEYGVIQADLESTLSKVHAVVWPIVDPLHPLQLELFKEPPKHVKIIPGVEHALFCLILDHLQLHAHSELWQ